MEKEVEGGRGRKGKVQGGKEFFLSFAEGGYRRVKEGVVFALCLYLVFSLLI
jgi:hypothetical protein